MKPGSFRRFFLLFLCCALFSGLLALKLQYGNKYASRPLSYQGGEVIFYGSGPVFLLDKWEFFQYQFLSPQEIGDLKLAPTTSLYIGEYGGFELDNPDAPPHGSGTYRLRIRVDDAARMYALELPQIYSSYCLWVNGFLMRSVGVPDQPDPQMTAGPLVTFPAAGQIELVLAVSDDSHLYSGLTYPPAFGTPDALSQLLSIRTILSVAVLISALLVGCFFILVPLYLPNQRPLALYAALCLCNACIISRELVHALGLGNDIWLTIERLGYYGAFALLLLLQCWLGRLPRPWVWLNSALALSLFVWSLIFPMLAQYASAKDLIFYSQTLACFKWLVGGLLMAGALYATVRGERDSFCLLVGSSLFACALIADRLVSLYEPILLFWPIELAAYLHVLILFYILLRRTVSVYQDSLLTREHERSARRVAQVRYEQYHELTAHMSEVREMRHELLGLLMQLQYYLHTGNRPALEQRLQNELGRINTIPAYSKNGLINALLSIYYKKSLEFGIELKVSAGGLPEILPMDDTDMVSILTNLLDNALTACISIPQSKEREISLTLVIIGAHLKILCSNTCGIKIQAQHSLPRSTKTDRRNHGLGLQIVYGIIGNYNGTLEWRCSDSTFQICVVLALL